MNQFFVVDISTAFCLKSVTLFIKDESSSTNEDGGSQPATKWIRPKIVQAMCTVVGTLLIAASVLPILTRLRTISLNTTLSSWLAFYESC